MKKVIVSSMICVLVYTQTLLNQDFVNEINSNQNQWVATSNNKFNGMTEEQLKVYLGLHLQNTNNQIPVVSYEHILEFTDAPQQFDSRQQWPKWIHEIRDQGKCGSCWAFESSEALSDRFSIATRGDIDIVMSPQYQVSCDNFEKGCNGGIFLSVWKFLLLNGTTSEKCVPYTSSKGIVENCPKTCVNGSDIIQYKIKKVKTYKTVDDSKLDIMINGPIYTGFLVYSDFMSYESGIYKYTTGTLLGGHAVKALGWGIQNGIKYWIAANSWGSDWGDNGFFKIQEGECRFEDKLIAGDVLI